MSDSDNISATPQDAGAPSHGAVAVRDEPHHHLALDTPIGRVYWVELLPGDSTMLHRHNFDYVTVVIGDARVGDRRAEEEEEKIKPLADGYTFYSRAAFEHEVRNAGKTTFYNFTMSMLRNGGGPENSLFEDIGTGCKHGRIFDERAARAAEVLLKAGETLDLRGDTILIVRDTALAPTPDVDVSCENLQHLSRTLSVAPKRRLARLRRPKPNSERKVHLYYCGGRTRVTAKADTDLVLIGIR